VVVSRTTLRRVRRKPPTPAFPTPKVLGVDDFALRQRQTSGTVRIALERRHLVALLPDRPAETVAQWRRAPRGVQVIVRDRATASADGAWHGAPAATQGADRLHIFQHLREALAQVCSPYSHVLDAVNATLCPRPVPLPNGALAVPVPPHAISLPAQQRAAARQARQQALHTQVGPLHRQGWTAPAIAQQVGRRLRTVQRDLRSAPFAGRKRRSDRGARGRNPYKPYLLARWHAGGDNAMRLFRALRQRGYAGGDGVVAA
jgi:transposase